MIAKAAAHAAPHTAPAHRSPASTSPPPPRLPGAPVDTFKATKAGPKGTGPITLDRPTAPLPEPLRRYNTKQLVDLCEAAKKGDPAATAKLKQLFEDVVKLSPTGAKILDWIKKEGIEIRFEDNGHPNQAEMSTTADGRRSLTVNLTTLLANLNSIQGNADLLAKGQPLPAGTEITGLPFASNPNSPVFPLVAYASSLAHEGFHWMVGDVPFQGGGAFGLPKNLPRDWGDKTDLTYLINGRVVAEILGVPYTSNIVTGAAPSGFNYNQMNRAKELVEPMKLQWMNGKPGDGYLIGGPWDRFVATPKEVFSLFDGLY